MISINKVMDRIYCVNVDDHYELAMMFLRYQEFYESYNPKFRGQPFTIAEFSSWYTRERGFDKSFSYAMDWAGFNIPLDIVLEVHTLGIRDPNYYDDMMFGIYGFISSQCHEPAYLVGHSNNVWAMKHEITHGIYFANDEYRKACDKIINKSTVRDQLSDILKKVGYTDKVINDEIQAYITTGELSYFKEVKSEKDLNKLRQKLKELHSEYFSEDMLNHLPINKKPVKDENEPELTLVK